MPNPSRGTVPLIPDCHFLDGLPDEEGPVAALQSPHWLIVDLELALRRLNMQVIQADPRLLEDLVQTAEEVRVLSHAEVGEEVLAGENGGSGLLVEKSELQLHPAEERVAQARQPLQLPPGNISDKKSISTHLTQEVCNTPDTTGLQHT
jgi:hypothetical protein